MAERRSTTRPGGGTQGADALRARCAALVDLVFTEDTLFLDALPDRLQADLVPALGLLAQALDAPEEPAGLARAARLVEECGVPREECPPELKAMLERLLR
ncbi:hypothetical protein ACFQ77_07470 [Streptomyces virginiae]|uniref:hypothetical protein n=1 Tax=Streptomyces virginiae TaxID=1961 RepID=UPI0030E34079